MLKGLSLAGMRSHPSLIPLFACAFVGSAAAAGYLLRLATKCPDVSWTRSNAEPWQEYNNKKYKMYDAGHDNVDIVVPPKF